LYYPAKLAALTVNSKSFIRALDLLMPF
jgi:hypothetical protein